MVDNWNGRLTRRRDGNINSGMASYYTSWGYDTFIYNGTLTFSQGTTNIAGSVITDLIVAGKIHVESGITYLYCIGHTGRFYKIQVNNPSTYSPDYDNPVLIGTLANGQTFKYGASMEFYQGAGTEKVWIGHDTGITKINFDGSGETNLTAGWTINVPRQVSQFIGKLFYTDGTNLATVDSTETVTTHTAISPGFPKNTTARDIRLNPDGRYIVSVVTLNAPGDMTSPTPNASDIAAMPGYLIYWNGTDTAASSISSFPSFSLQSYYAFAGFEYLFGYNSAGFSFGNPNKVIFLPEFENTPQPNAISSSGDFMGWASTLLNPSTGNMDACFELYGTIDSENPTGLYRQLKKASVLTGGDVVRIPFFIPVSLQMLSGISSGYFNPISNPVGEVGSGKSYFSTVEYDGATTSYGFYMFKNVQDYLTATNKGVYETQHQIFSKKVKVTQVRVYLEPATALTSFTVEIIGIDAKVITGTSKTFSGITGKDMVEYNPASAPTACVGLRITNVGSYTPFIHKVEIDVTPWGN